MNQMANAIKVSAGYGRLYVTGPAYKAAARLPGATHNDRRSAIEISLTLESLRRLKKAMGLSSKELARFCTPEVMQWATGAARMDKIVSDLHKRVGDGFRLDLPWDDMQAGTVAYRPQTPDDLRKIEEHDGMYFWKYRPAFDHQKIMATVACHLDGCAFVCEMGTGKTRAAVESVRFMIESRQLDVIVVVAPKGVLRTWEQEVALWGPGVKIEVLKGSVAERRKVIQQWRATPAFPHVLALNYDVVHALKADLKAFCEKYRVGLVADEMHRAKNPAAKVTKALLDISTVTRWRLGMTGSPVLQGIQDVWSQWYVVDLGLTFGANYTQYKREFLNENSWTFQLDPKEGALDEVGMRMRKRGIRYTKAECLDLPPKMYETIEVSMTPEQARAYAQMEMDLIAELDTLEGTGEVTAANQLAMILRLTQITSGFAPNEFGQIHRFRPNPKLDALEEIVREQIREQQILVWARYTEDIAIICERLQDLSPVVVVGEGAVSTIRRRGTPVPSREEARDRFQSGESRLLVANPGAGGVGLNLWRASLAIYYSQGYSLEHRIQSEDRCHRSGSEMHESVTYIDLPVVNSIDQVIVSALMNKKSVAEVVVDLRKTLGLSALAA